MFTQYNMWDYGPWIRVLYIHASWSRQMSYNTVKFWFSKEWAYIYYIMTNMTFTLKLSG